jgi:hypothetical protein
MSWFLGLIRFLEEWLYHLSAVVFSATMNDEGTVLSEKGGFLRG